jgi:hypothetical protein
MSCKDAHFRGLLANASRARNVIRKLYLPPVNPKELHMLKLVIKENHVREAVNNANALLTYGFDAEDSRDVRRAKALDKAVTDFNAAVEKAWLGDEDNTTTEIG